MGGIQIRTCSGKSGTPILVSALLVGVLHLTKSSALTPYKVLRHRRGLVLSIILGGASLGIRAGVGGIGRLRLSVIIGTLYLRVMRLYFQINVVYSGLHSA